MEWNDEGIILSARPHGETAAIVMLLTAQNGRHAGLVPGGQGRKGQSDLQPGNRVQARWRGRLLDHLGTYTLDVMAAHAAPWLDEMEVLSVISACCAVTEAALPERQPMPGVYAGLSALMALPDAALWGPVYVRWELGLLQALGFGLDLTKCAVSGSEADLSHVSPRTGRAVSSQEARPYKSKLLTLPGFLLGGSSWNAAGIAQGLELTGHFLARHVFAHPHSGTLIAQAGELPLARQRLAEFYQRAAEAEARVA